MENNIEETTQIVTSNYNKILVLENLNADLKINLEETTEKLNNVKTKLNFQNDLRQKGYDDYQVKLASMKTTIGDLENSLKEANAELKNEIHLKNSLKEKNAEKDTEIEGLERSNAKVKSELEKTKDKIEMLENQLKTGTKAQLRSQIEELKDSNVESQMAHLSEVSSQNKKIKNLEIQMKTLEVA